MYLELDLKTEERVDLVGLGMILSIIYNKYKEYTKLNIYIYNVTSYVCIYTLYIYKYGIYNIYIYIVLRIY